MPVPTIARPAAATYGRPTECDSVKPMLIGAYWAPMLRPTSPDEMKTFMASISIKRFRSFGRNLDRPYWQLYTVNDHT
jgi:hypothetical protein